jgi:hypothetical protein
MPGIWRWSVFIGGRENPDTLYNEFGEPSTFHKKTEKKLSHAFRSVWAGFKPRLTRGERPNGTRPMS